MNKKKQEDLEQTNQHALFERAPDRVIEVASLFIQPEKDLPTIGFFTPTSKQLKGKRKKVVRLAPRAGTGGVEVERSITIVAGGDYGLPGTADLDKWLALQKIIGDIREEKGEVRNPISFTTAELLSILGVHKESGQNYKSVEE